MTYINDLYAPPTEALDPIDIEVLLKTYQKWLSVFPFEIYPFNQLKEAFHNSLPGFTKNTVYNPYTGMTKGRIVTKNELANSLIHLTKTILKSVNSVDLVQEGRIDDYNGHQLNLENESYRLKQAKLLEDFSDSESKYVEIIKKWYKNTKKHFNKVIPLLSTETSSSKPGPEKVEERKNLFNKMPINEVESWFMQLSTESSKNGNPFLKNEDVQLFIKRAFEAQNALPKLTLNYGPREKLTIWKLFYQYYQRCVSSEKGVERGVQCRDRYIRLLTDNFTNFTFEEVKLNFSKSNQMSKDWKVPI